MLFLSNRPQACRGETASMNISLSLYLSIVYYYLLSLSTRDVRPALSTSFTTLPHPFLAAASRIVSFLDVGRSAPALCTPNTFNAKCSMERAITLLFSWRKWWDTLDTIGTIIDDRLKEKSLKPWKGVLCIHFLVCVCVCVRGLHSTPFDLGT